MGCVVLLTWTVVVTAPTRLLVGCVLLTVVAIVPSVWEELGIGAVNRKHTMSFHVNSNKRHKEIRTSIELCYHETQIRCNLASYPGHVGGGKSGLVSTVCACTNDSGNFSRTSPIMDKLHVVVMRRNHQTRYTAYSVAASCVYSVTASIIRDTSGDTTRTTLQPPSVPPSLYL